MTDPVLPLVILLQGQDRLDLNSGRFKIDDVTFQPPGTERDVTYSRRQAGADAVGKRPVNRVWTFRVTIIGSQPGEALAGLRELRSFLNRAGDPLDPLYLRYRHHSVFAEDPFYGLAGAAAKYEIVHGVTREAVSGFNATVTHSSKIVNVLIALAIKPATRGPALRLARAKGALYEDHLGRPDGVPRGTQVQEATTNLFPNPIFGHATFSTSWSAFGSGVIVDENKNRRFVLFGDTSVKIQKTTVAAGDRYTASITATAATYQLSFYAKALDEGAITSSDLRGYYGGVEVPDYIWPVGDGWYRVICEVTGSASATDTGVSLNTNQRTFYLDGFQLELKDYPTPVAHGDLVGCSWTSTAHNSSTTRTEGDLRTNFADFFPGLVGYTLRFVWDPGDALARGFRYLMAAGNIGLWINASNHLVYATASGQSAQVNSITATPGTPICIHVTYDGSNIQIAIDGVVLGTASSRLTVTAKPTTVFFGHDGSTNNHAGGTLMGLAAFPFAMTAAMITADYNDSVGQIAAGERIDPIPHLWTDGGDDVLTNDCDGTNRNWGYVAGLMGDDSEFSYYFESSNNFALARGLTWGHLPIRPQLMDQDLVDFGGSTNLLFLDAAGGADVNANNNVAQTTSVSTATITLLTTSITERGAELLQAAREIYALIVVKEAAGTPGPLQLRLSLEFGGTAESLPTRWRTVASSTSFRPFLLGPISLAFDREIMDSRRKLGFALQARRATGSTGNLLISHALFLPNLSDGEFSSGSANDAGFVRGRIFEFVASGTATDLTVGQRIFRAPLQLRPGFVNVLAVQHTFDSWKTGFSTWVSGYSIDITKAEVIPFLDVL